MHRHRPGKVAGALLTCLALCGVAGCGDGNPEVALDQSYSGTEPATITVTMTEQVVRTRTIPVTATTTVPVTTTLTVTASPSTTPPPVLNPTAAQPVPAEFDRAAGEAAIKAILADVAAVDGALAGPGPADAQLTMLDHHLGALLAAGVPPTVDGPSHVSRVQSLRIFTTATATESQANRTQAASRWEVVRRETGVLISQLNGALATTHTLPPSPTATP